MDLSNIHVGIVRRKKKKRVGRGPGSGHGKTSSRGAKGQYASAGAKKPRWTFEGGQMPLFRRIPKRGFSHGSWDDVSRIINVGDLSDCFDEGAVIDPEVLRETGLLKGQYDTVRVLGNGEVVKKLTVKAHHFSKSAQEKIKAKGGAVEIIARPKKPVRNKMKPRPAAQK
jgi:large subunit ribosomal protein L15